MKLLEGKVAIVTGAARGVFQDAGLEISGPGSCRRWIAAVNWGNPGQPVMRPRRLPDRYSTKVGTPCNENRRPSGSSA